MADKEDDKKPPKDDDKKPRLPPDTTGHKGETDPLKVR
jgi:hypothetical protein